MKDNIISDVDLAYLAGFIDADGHIGIVRRNARRGAKEYHYVRPVVQIGQSKREILDWISDLVGGSVHIHAQRNFYNLRFHAGMIRWLMPLVIPYLKVKKRQAELVLEFTKISSVARNGRSLSDHEKARREGLRVECGALNAKQEPKEANVTELKVIA